MRKLEASKLITCGHSSRLECRATGSPVITFKWFKDEMEIASSPKYAMAVDDLVASLEIVQCTVEESGDYVCLASSEAGSDRCSSTVTVKGWFHGKHPSLAKDFGNSSACVPPPPPRLWKKMVKCLKY